MTTLKIEPGEAAAGQELVISRTFHARRELVFQAWTDPRRLVQWWGPRGFTNPVCELDLRPGGALYIEMRAPDGSLHPAQGVFHEIAPPERLVFTTFAFEGENGEPQLEVKPRGVRHRRQGARPAAGGVLRGALWGLRAIPYPLSPNHYPLAPV